MEQKIEYNYYEGSDFSNVEQGLKIAVSKYARQAKCVYIGITGDIEQRTQRHYARSRKRPNDVNLGIGWTRMIAIYNTTSDSDAKQAEKVLIKFLRMSPDLAHKCLNKTMGGELIDQYKHYFVYILLGPESVRKAYWEDS